MTKLSNIEKAILKPLLGAYERKNSSRRVIIGAQKYPDYDLNNIEKKKLFISGLDLLVKKGFISYEWEKFEKGNLVKRVILKEEKVNIVYNLLGEINQEDRVKAYLNELESYKAIVKSQWILEFLEDEVVFVSDKKKWSRVWPKTQDERREFMSLLCAIQDDGDISLRYLSSKLYSDSKKLERNYKAKLVSLAQKYIPLDLESDEVLDYLGIEMNPSEILFCGDMKYNLEGHVVNAGLHIYGTSINKKTVLAMDILKVGANRILTIENKATYYEYIKVKDPDELVVYIGGFFGRSSRVFLNKLKAKSHGDFYHWSDIDLGGLRIYRYLCEVLDLEIIPKFMSAKIYEEYRGVMADRLSEANLKAIRLMLNDPRMDALKSTIELVLQVGLRLEQEMIEL